MITADLTGNIGNHLFQYVITRLVAENNNYAWGFNKVPSHDYYHGLNQMYFMDIDFGQEHNTPWGKMLENINELWYEKYETINYNNGDRVDFHSFQPEIFHIKDKTKLVIRCCQDKRYFENNKNKIQDWLKIKENKIQEYNNILKDQEINLNKDLCIINVRGGEYKSIPNVILVKEYWQNAVALMKKKNSKMQFIVVTDDVEYARRIFSIPVVHFGIGMDYFMINNAKNLIISNSSFAIFPTWLNKNNPYVIAPKYWARHNVSDGYYANSDMKSFGWNFMDRDGKINE